MNAPDVRLGKLWRSSRGRVSGSCTQQARNFTELLHREGWRGAGARENEYEHLQRRDVAEGSERCIAGDQGIVGEGGDEDLHGLWNGGRGG
jgi:hypothetical protein